jgi:hypothetical protein
MYRLTTLEANDLLRSALSRTHGSRAPSALSAVKGMVVAVAVAIGEAKVSLIRVLAELILTTSHERLPFMSVDDTKRRDFASSATKRGTVSSNSHS